MQPCNRGNCLGSDSHSTNRQWPALTTGCSLVRTATASPRSLSSAQSRMNTSTSLPAIFRPCLTAWRLPTPVGPLMISRGTGCRLP